MNKYAFYFSPLNTLLYYLYDNYAVVECSLKKNELNKNIYIWEIE